MRRREIQRRSLLRRLAVLLALAALAAAALGAAGSAVGARPSAKPPRPPHDHPTTKGLVSALGGAGGVAQTSPSAAVATTPLEGGGIPGAVGASTLVLYDTGGDYGWLGELYAAATGNLVSHFGPWRAEPVAAYRAGELLAYTAVVYVGSTYDEPLPDAFLDDVWSGARPVVWIYDNIWELTNRYAATFAGRYGWSWSQFDLSAVGRVDYRGVSLTRDAADNGAGIMDYSSVDPTKATVLARAVRADGTTFPWAIRSGNLVYVGENPYVYTSETDRVLAFEDMLFDVLDPAAGQRHRALVRLEDVDPHSDAASFKQAVDYLYAQRIPFGFAVVPVYSDPLAVENPAPTTVRLAGSEIATLVRYAIARGGTLVDHGLTHQYSTVRNPYDGLTGDDYEFYRVVEQADHSLDYQGPLPGDSTAWALGRMDAARSEFAAAGVPEPLVFEFPHYAASAADYAAAQQRFGIRWDRALYFGHLADGSADPARAIGQMFPWVVRDAYGSVVLPENLGDYEPEPFYTFPAHSVADVLAAADADGAVRDGVASFYYHPFFGLDPLRQIVQGLLARGWTFADPATLAGIGRPSAPTNLAPPAISGVARVGETLSASSGTWTGDPAPAYTYRWERCDTTGGGCSPVTGATGSTYTPQSADVGRTLRVEVTATNTMGSAAVASAPTSIVTAASQTGAAPASVTPPTITGTPRVGQALSASPGTWTGDPAPTYAYRWYRCNAAGSSCSSINRATASTYEVKKADVGHTLRVAVTATNPLGSATAASAPTQVALKKG